MFWIFVRIATLGRLEQISKTYVSLKFYKQCSCIICDYLLPLKQKFRDSQIVIITSYVVVSSIGIKRVVCLFFVFFFVFLLLFFFLYLFLHFYTNQLYFKVIEQRQYSLITPSTLG